ncbi:AAEL013351-PA [Aedes aegypti]|uniref:AAEL013351-PA n=2 Tax=Aedes aegypti TaxID=7159 RepID=A0A1S4FYY0_AEDAE|nr:protein lethal(2)essential for life [Aedes aegypti]EAT34415.1 AAEL013351-PA [Aedes aegypti]
MALSNSFFRNWWNTSLRASRMLDHHFGPTNELLNSMRLAVAAQNALLDEMTNTFSRPWFNRPSDSESLVKIANNKFQINLDVQNFAPEEISVKATDDSIIVEGKHEERQDEHGFITRHFVRRFMLPAGHDRDGIVSSLSSDGVLTIMAPIKEQLPKEDVKAIPIVQTGEPQKERIAAKSETSAEKSEKSEKPEADKPSEK